MHFSVLLLKCYLLLLCFIVIVEGSHRWRNDRRPKIFGTRMPKKMLSPHSRKVQHKIVAYHNYFRSNVKPNAANMLEMTWHKSASQTAQKWSNKCQFLRHDNATDRWLQNYGGCGQNIFVSTHEVPWFFAIKSWFLEYRNFTYGSDKNDLGIIGHYTQMVWATSHKVGCGYSECKTDRGKRFFNYICNYCPSGNFIDILGKPYVKGAHCRDCPNDCNSKTKLCTNFCPFADLWVNCAELSSQWREWLCKDKSKEGLRRRKHCRATCSCKNKILPNYSKPIMTNVQYINNTTIFVKVKT